MASAITTPPGTEAARRAVGWTRRAGSAARQGRRGPTLVVAACLAVSALSLLLPSTPSYDPWAWIVWGREIASLRLDTLFGPSWKPLPVLFTAPFSVFGAAAPALWLVVARAGALLGLVAAFRVARRGGGVFAGLLVVALLALSSGYLREPALGYSEGLLVAFALLAFDRHVVGNHGRALALGLGAGLLRPETWPFLGVYALIVFVREPRHRALAVAVVALLPLLWLGPELWGSGNALRAAARARDPTQLSPAFAAQPWLAVLVRASEMAPWPAKAGALFALALAAGAAATGATRHAGAGAGAARLRARVRALASPQSTRDVLSLAAAAAVWLALVAVMTEFGYAGNARYLAMPVALCALVGGIGLAWLARVPALLLVRRRPGRVLAIAATTLPAALVVLASLPLLRGPLDDLRRNAGEIRYEARLDAHFPPTLALAGGRARVLACGRPNATALQVPLVAWYLDVPIRQIGLEPAAPATLFRGPPALQPPDEPAPAPTAGGLRPIARVDGWTFSSSC